MAHSISFKRRFQLTIFRVCWVLRHQCRTTVPGELEREIGVRFQGPRRRGLKQAEDSQEQNVQGSK